MIHYIIQVLETKTTKIIHPTRGNKQNLNEQHL
jgi:hypothetical protein